MIKYPLLFLHFLILWSWELEAQEQKEWKLVKKEGQLYVYVTGTTSQLREIRIIHKINGSVNDAMQVLDDVPNYCNWVYKCISATRVESIDENEYYYYTQTDLPFPFSDRDLVVHSKQWLDKVTGIYYSESELVNDLVPLNEGFVRMTMFKSTWEIAPLPNGYIKVEYEVTANPGGKIPLWLINLAVAIGPFETMKKFAKTVGHGFEQ